MFYEAFFLTTFQPANKCKLSFFDVLIIEGGRKNGWFLFLPSSVFCRMSDDHRMFFSKYKAVLQKKRIPIPGKQVAVNLTLNFTPKTSHSCLKKMGTFLGFSRYPQKTTKRGISTGFFRDRGLLFFTEFCGIRTCRETQYTQQCEKSNPRRQGDSCLEKRSTLRELQEPQNGGLEDDFPVQRGVIFRSMLVFQGVFK